MYILYGFFICLQQFQYQSLNVEIVIAISGLRPSRHWLLFLQKGHDKVNGYPLAMTNIAYWKISIYNG